MHNCSSDGCPSVATTWLRFAGMGDQLHVHVCPSHEAIDREWCDVVDSGPLPCPHRLGCTQQPVASGVPPLLAL